ncbi:MAG: NAD-dependent epimerase/dehydratase family protein [Candidatus Aenigmatarchaeota archaeon]
MKILVTGDSGFVGTHIVKRLLELKHDVKGFSINRGEDIRDFKILDKAVKGKDVVIHLAAQTDVRKSFENPKLDYEINYEGTKNVVKACEKHGAHLIFTSSAAVYGNSIEIPTKEDSPKLPVSFYGLHKLLAEKECERIDAFIIRPFNIYGPRGHSVINNLINNIKSEREIVLFNDGSHTRDYVHINDVVSALIIGLKSKGIYNIASGKETSLRELIEIISKQIGKKPKIKYKILKEGDAERSVADISKAKRELGWKPKIELKDGIKNIIDYVIL